MGADSKTKVALLIVGEGDAGAPGDSAIGKRLETLGYQTVERFDSHGSMDAQFDGKTLVVVSSLKGSSSFGAALKAKRVPVVVADGGTLAALGMVTERGEETGPPASLAVSFSDLEHSLAATHAGMQVTADKFFQKEKLKQREQLKEGEVALLWGTPFPTAQRVAWLSKDPERKSLIFAYERGDLLRDRPAAARRVAIPFGGDVALAMTSHAWALFDAAVAWAVGEELKQFSEVFTEEWREVRERRQRQRIYSARSNGHHAGAGSHDSPPRNLAGLALSGGGIRSATFSLGLLQGMSESRVLRLFDYVSTVSGGGYVGGWWSAWLSRGQLEGHDGLAYPDFNASEITRADALVRKLLKRCTAPAGCAGHERHNAFAFYCRERIDETSVRLWGRFEAGHCPPEELKANLAKELSALVAGPCLYDAELRADVPSFAGAKFAVLPGAHPGRKGLRPVRLPLHGLYGRASLKKFFDAETSSGVKRLGKETERLLATARAAQPGSFELMRLNRLLVEDAFPDEISSGYFPDAEGIEPERTEKYLRESRGTTRDGAGGDALLLDERKRCEEHAERDRDLMSAGRDPVHHLRLFSNYLTPRKGLLSNDTWRAVSVITRDLVMTWLILLPVILAAVLLGQLYFILWPSAESNIRRIAPRHDFVTSYESEIALAKGRLESVKAVRANMTQALSGEGPDAAPSDELRRADLTNTVKLLEGAERGEAERLEALRVASRSWMAHRLKLMVWPLVALAGLIVLMVSAWNVLNNTGTNSQSIFAGVAVWLIIGFSLFVCIPNLWVWPLYDRWGTWRGLSATPFFPAKLALLAVYAAGGFLLWMYARRKPKAYAGVCDGLDAETRTQRVRDVQRNQMVRMQTSLLVYFVITALVLLVAGFGHEVVGRMINLDVNTRSALVARWGGILTTVLGIAGAIFTAVKATPAGGGDQKETEEPSLPSRVVFACTPPLIIVILFMGAAWLAHGMLQAVTAGEEFRVRIPPLTWAMSVSIIVALGFAVGEIGWRRRRPTVWLIILTVGACVLGVGYDLKQEIISPFQRLFPLALLTFSTIGILLRLGVKEATGGDDKDNRLRVFRFVVARPLLGGFRPTAWQLAAIALAATSVLLVCFFAVLWGWEQAWYGVMDRSVGAHRVPLASFALAGLLLCAGLLLTEIFRGTGDHRRALALLAAANVSLGALLIISLYANYRQFPRLLLFHAAFGLLASALGWVVALGWLADPNALSLHDFYKARLVRAYLGASNPVRRLAPTEVTESAEGDDLPLSQLKNCQRGGPYHLVNATLNLAAARDLTTAQRSSAAFVLTKLNCGSSRTGYRRTDRYMSGRLSLGTAVATSGAAASPNMGSRTPSASLAMLMTLLNVRLGYWAPTPNKEHWQLTQAQLWPFYVLREFLSQTNDLSSYSYLTDGGHFDNTGLYSLVERGCRFIVVADSGADPAPCFSDLGDAIRRCRIDFGAEITLRVETFFRDERTQLSPGHFVVGKITYCDEHLRGLRWTQEEIERGREGVIVLFKPSLTSGVSADVRQYGIENKNFPQQGTADQWFDESQFESYRRLGEHCASQLFGDFVTEGKPEGSKAEGEARLRRGRAALSLKEIEDYFEGLYERHNDSGAEARRRRVREELWRVVAAESAGRGVELTPGCRHYLEDLVAAGAAKLGASESNSPELGAAKENLRQIVREAARRAWCAGTRRLHESVLIEAADARTSYPFFEKEANGHRNGGGSNGRA